MMTPSRSILIIVFLTLLLLPPLPPTPRPPFFSFSPFLPPHPPDPDPPIAPAYIYFKAACLPRAPRRSLTFVIPFSSPALYCCRWCVTSVVCWALWCCGVVVVACVLGGGRGIVDLMYVEKK
ncbi:hypothetical protein R3P38DRAFT_1228701 [Favolaschia claudopus]|uniref:Transmembrane protein n=1 Tax=Favolaschia claudopus TaxID=2862362 RepID=A0AAW0B1M3_9AGAR